MLSSLFWKLRLLFHDRQETRDRVRRLRRQIADDLQAGGGADLLDLRSDKLLPRRLLAGSTGSFDRGADPVGFYAALTGGH